MDERANPLVARRGEPLLPRQLSDATIDLRDWHVPSTLSVDLIEQHLIDA